MLVSFNCIVALQLTPTRVSAEKELAKYNRKSYSLQELLKRPEEVDPSKLETYLSDEEFEVT